MIFQAENGTQSGRSVGASPGRFFPFRWVIVFLLCAMSFVLSVDRFNITIAIPDIKQWFGFSENQRGDILAAFMFGYAAALVPGGWLADRFGPWRVFTLAGACWAIVTACTGLIGWVFYNNATAAFVAFMTARVLLGVCEACAFPTFAKAAGNWVRRQERALTTGFIQAAFGLGGTITPVMIVWVITRWRWPAAFYASAVLTLVVVVVWWLAARDRPEEHPWVTQHELERILADREEKHPPPITKAWFLQLLRCRSAYMLCLSQFFFGVSGFAFFSWYFTYFVEVRRVSAQFAAWLQAMPFAAMLVGSSVGGVMIDLLLRRWGQPWGRRTVPLVSITFGGLCGIVAPAIADDLLAGIVFAFAAGLLYMAAAGFWSTVIDLTRQGTGVLGGIQNAANWLGAALATSFFPRLLQAGTSWETGLQLAGLAGVVSGLVWLFIDPRQQIDRITPRSSL